jgi:hypothetical protein
MTEKQIQSDIIRAVGTLPWLRLWRSHTGGAWRQGRFITFGIPGQADLTGIVPVTQVLACPHCGGELSTPPLGVRVEVEVKTPTGRQSDDQKNFQKIIERFHGIYILACSTEDVTQALEPYRGCCRSDFAEATSDEEDDAHDRER